VLTSVDVRYINPFIAAVEHVFKTMLGTAVLVGKPTIRDKHTPDSDVAAVIAFSGAATGNVSLCFTKQTAVKVARKFTGARLMTQDPTALSDALGELANMVAGQARATLPEGGIEVSLPQVVFGHQQRAPQSVTSPVLLLACDSKLGRFSVQVTMVVQRGSPFSPEAPKDSSHETPDSD
jgi:chemotaxis protein CheX